MTTTQRDYFMNHAFVTGATGLLGNNLVRALLDRNIQVTALVRSRDKAKQQFADLSVRLVEGDICRSGGTRNRSDDVRPPW